MLSLKQVTFASVLVFALLSMAAAQESTSAQPLSLTITAAAAGERVRITAPSSVVQMHVEVYAGSGERLFDQEIRGGNIFDWHLQDGQGQRLAAGSYVCVVTAKSIHGKLTQKIGSVRVEEGSVSVQPAESRQLSAPQAQTIGPVEENSSWTIAGKDEPPTATVIAHDGTDGQMIRGRGALSFRLGDFFSGIDKEQMRLTEEGNLGIGVSQPKALLDVAGTIRAQRVLITKPASDSRTAADNNTQAANSADSAQPLASGSGTQNQIAKWADSAGTLGDSVITETSGNIGLGVTSPGDLLDIAGAPNPSGRSGIRVRTTAITGNTTLYFDNDRGNFAAYGGLITGGSANSFTFFGVTRADKTFLIADGPASLGLGVGTLVPKPVIFGTNNAERMRIDSSGNVGIGTTSPNPSSLLDVAGNINVAGNAVIAGNIAAKYQDVAEWVQARQPIAPGTLVVLDPGLANAVLPSARAYDTHVAGVVSAQPGITLGQGGAGKVLVATTGRVRIRVDATHHPIKIGDLLVTSNKPGVAMKSLPIMVRGVQIHRPGTIVGKALEPLPKGAGEIFVLLSLQ